MLIYINSNKFPFVDMSGLTFLYKTEAWKEAPSQLDPASVQLSGICHVPVLQRFRLLDVRGYGRFQQVILYFRS